MNKRFSFFKMGGVGRSSWAWGRVEREAERKSQAGSTHSADRDGA